MGVMDKITNPKAMIVGLIMLVVGIQVAAQLLPTLITAIINISGISNLGFASFFAANGIVLLMLGVAVLLAILGILGLGESKR